MSRKMLLTLLLGFQIVFGFPVHPIQSLASTVSAAKKDSAVAPIREHKLDYYEFSFRSSDGKPFDIREYAKDKRLLLIEYFAGWCPNSNRNGVIVERLWTKYRQRGFGLIGVAEYSDPDELRIHIGRVGIDYPIVIETENRGQRKKSTHYKYRRAVGDDRKWGTPFYVIIDTRDIESSDQKGLLSHRVYTVAGELDEIEADRFLSEHLNN
jgi:hypothetical protein